MVANCYNDSMTIEYNNPTPVAVCLVKVGPDSLMAIRRSIQPKLGELAFPGGYVDEMETAEVAAARELMEETGFYTKPEDWSPITTRITPTNNILIFCICSVQFGVEDLAGFVPNSEASGVTYVNELDTLGFPTHTSVLQNPQLWKK